MKTDITCIITGHREGRLCIASLRSFWIAIQFAEMSGYKVQPILMLDRPNQITQDLFYLYAPRPSNVHILDFGDQGLVRNSAVDLAKGEYTAFLDADDLWSEDWLVQALDFLRDLPDTHIAHPAYNYFFESQATIFCHIDQESPEFQLDMLRIRNYWDALCVCPTKIYREIPFYTRDIVNGWAYEDWLWSCETVSAGKVHKVVPESVLFKRRQKTSQTVKASENRSMIKPHAFSSYSSPIYEEDGRKHPGMAS